MTRPVVRFDLPVRDSTGPWRFRSAVPARPMRRRDAPGAAVAPFSHEQGQPTGCLFRSTDDPPAARNPLLHFERSGRLDRALEAVQGNGGAVPQPKRRVGACGRRAIVCGSEGNRMALHSP